MDSFRCVPRTKRYSAFSTLDHLLSRGVGQVTLFEEEADWRASLGVIGETLRLARMRIYRSCVMPKRALSALPCG